MKKYIKSAKHGYDINQLISVINNFDPYIADVKATRVGNIGGRPAKVADIPIRIADHNSDFSELITLWYKINNQNEWNWYWDPTAISLYDYDEYTELAEKITESPEVEAKVDELIKDWYTTYYNYK